MDTNPSTNTEIILFQLGTGVSFAPDTAFILEGNQRFWNLRLIHTPSLFCLYIGKMWKSPDAAGLDKNESCTENTEPYLL